MAELLLSVSYFSRIFRPINRSTAEISFSSKFTWRARNCGHSSWIGTGNDQGMKDKTFCIFPTVLKSQAGGNSQNCLQQPKQSPRKLRPNAPDQHPNDRPDSARVAWASAQRPEQPAQPCCRSVARSKVLTWLAQGSWRPPSSHGQPRLKQPQSPAFRRGLRLGGSRPQQPALSESARRMAPRSLGRHSPASRSAPPCQARLRVSV